MQLKDYDVYKIIGELNNVIKSLERILKQLQNDLKINK